MKLLHVAASCVLLLVFLRETIGCICPWHQGPRPRSEAICTSYTYSTSVYRANVVSAYCKCTTSTTQFSCINFYSSSSNVIGRVVTKYNCNDTSGSLPFYYDKCSSVINGAGSTSVTNTSTVEPIDCDDAYPYGDFNANNSGCDITHQPCYYTVRVEDVYKGNLRIGQLLNTSGPDVLTSCGQYRRVLSVGASYIAGIGGPCYSIAPWTDVANYQADDINLLVSLRNKSSMCTCNKDDYTCDTSTGRNMVVIFATVIPFSLIFVTLCLIILIVVIVVLVKYKTKTKGSYKTQENVIDSVEPVTQSTDHEDEKPLPI